MNISIFYFIVKEILLVFTVRPMWHEMQQLIALSGRKQIVLDNVAKYCYYYYNLIRNRGPWRRI